MEESGAASGRKQPNPFLARRFRVADDRLRPIEKEAALEAASAIAIRVYRLRPVRPGYGPGNGSCGMTWVSSSASQMFPMAAGTDTVMSNQAFQIALRNDPGVKGSGIWARSAAAPVSAAPVMSCR